MLITRPISIENEYIYIYTCMYLCSIMTVFKSNTRYIHIGITFKQFKNYTYGVRNALRGVGMGHIRKVSFSRRPDVISTSPSSSSGFKGARKKYSPKRARRIRYGRDSNTRRARDTVNVFLIYLYENLLAERDLPPKSNRISFVPCT